MRAVVSVALAGRARGRFRRFDVVLAPAISTSFLNMERFDKFVKFVNCVWRILETRKTKSDRGRW
jgi:hypothetical protein